jgi:outer membrane protein OmpA-like peptidoglycan-associated protein
MKRLLYTFFIPLLLFSASTHAQERDGINTDTLLFQLDVYAFDKTSKKPLGGAIVELIGTDGTKLEMTTNASGYCEFSENNGERIVKYGTTYNVTVLYENYLISKDQFSTVNRTKSTKFVKEFYLYYAGGGCGTITIPRVQFDKNKTTIRKTQLEAITTFYKVMQENPTIIAEVQGHSSEGESKTADLSMKRAEAVIAELVKRGIKKERLQARGYGCDHPRSSANDSINQRVSIAVISFDFPVPEVEKIDWDTYFVLEVYLYDKDTKEPLSGGSVTLTGSDGSVAKGSTDKDGAVIFEGKNGGEYIVKDTDYTVKIENAGKKIGEDSFSTKGVEKKTKFVKEFYQQRGIICKVFLPHVVFEGQQTKLKGSMLDSLNYMHSLLVENPTMVIQIAGFDYMHKNEKQVDKRLQFVANYLVKKGINKARLSTKTKELVVPEMGVYPERKVEFSVLSFDFVPKK